MSVSVVCVHVSVCAKGRAEIYTFSHKNLLNSYHFKNTHKDNSLLWVTEIYNEELP